MQTHRTPIKVPPEQISQTGSRRFWLGSAIAWTTLILFSSTSLAAEYCERAFGWVYGSTLRKYFSSAAAYNLLHLLADKGLHVTLFSVLGILLWRVFVAARWRRITEVVLLGLIIGTLSEILQGFFPGRDPALRDVMINVFGTLLGAAASAGLTRTTENAQAVVAHQALD
jgi:VanZ family protein